MEQPAATPAPAQSPEQTSVQAPPPAEDTRSPLERMTREERATWDKDGTLPAWAGGETPTKKEPAPAKDDEDAPAVDAKGQPVLENGKPISRRQQIANDRVRRAVEEGLAVERQRSERLERELAELRAQVGKTKTEPPAEDTRPTWERENRAPKLEDFADQDDPYQALFDAKIEHRFQQERAARERETAGNREIQTAEQKFQSYQEREDALKKDVPDFDAKTLPIRQAINPMTPLGAALLDSPVAPRLILHFAEHPDDFERIGRLGMHPAGLPAALRELGKLEARYESSPAASAPAQEPATPPVKRVSDAPPPPPALGTRSAEPADEAAAAVARSDFSAYERAQNQKELAAFRGR